MAVISKKFEKDWWKAEIKLSKIGLVIDLRIKAHGFSPQNFQNDCDPLIYEIKQTGIKIA